MSREPKRSRDRKAAAGALRKAASPARKPSRLVYPSEPPPRPKPAPPARPAAAPRPPPAPAKPQAPAKPPVPPRERPPPVASSHHRGVPSSGTVVRGPDEPVLRVGDDLVALQRGPITRVDIARYCGASGQFNPLALDEPHARSLGLPSVVLPPAMALGLAQAQVSRWLAGHGHIVRLGARSVKILWPGDHLIARSRVSEVRPTADGFDLDLDLWVENQRGELVLRGQATCRIPRRVPGMPAGGLQLRPA